MSAGLALAAGTLPEPHVVGRVAMLPLQEADMARRRLQVKGSVLREGGWWIGRWYDDVRCEDGRLKRTRPRTVIGLCTGAEKLTEKQARRKFYEDILRHVNANSACPQSLMTLRQFVVQRFEPEHVWSLKHAGKEHYKYCLSKILPELGDVALRDLNPQNIQALVRKLVDAGKSVQTAAHVRTAMHVIIEHAKRAGHFTGENPARFVKLPEMVHRPIQALSAGQATAALAILPSPVLEMVFLSITTSPNVAELCGLRWKRLNLTEGFTQADGVTIPPFSALIVENWYRNRPGTVKTARRNRIVPLPARALEMLAAWRSQTKFAGLDDYVFSGRTGKPIDAHNTNSRLFKRVGAAVNAKVSWHVFRHSCATFAEQVGMAHSDRIALMGHARGEMTDRYTHSDNERRRESVEKIADLIKPFEKPVDSGPSNRPEEIKVQWLQ